MPFIFDPNLDQDDEDEQQAVASGGAKIAGGSGTGEPPALDSSSPGMGSNPARKDLNTGSGFQNLDKYLGANQAHEFGQKVTGRVGETINKAQQNQQQASDSYKNIVQSANHTPEQSEVDQALANPTEANPSQFQDWMKQSYSGPNNLAESQDAWGKYWSGTNQAQAQAKALGSESGRFSLLDSYFGRPQYNFGEKSLDNLLVQQSGLGAETKKLQDDATNLRTQGEDQAKTLQGFATTRAGQVDKSRKQVNDAFNQANTSAQGEIQQTYAQAQADRASRETAMKEQLRTGVMSDEAFADLGLNEALKNLTTYGVDGGKYLSTNNLTKEQVASDDQRSRLNALAQLAGVGQDYLGDKQDLSKAFNFDQNGFMNEIQGKGASYRSDLGKAMDVIKSTAPLQGEYLSTLNAQSNPGEVLSTLNDNINLWIGEKQNGNPFADARLQALNDSKAALMGTMNQYGIDEKTGLAQFLRTQQAVKPITKPIY